MPEEFQMNDREKQLLRAWTLNNDMVSWTDNDKVVFLAYLNRRARLPFGTIGLLATTSKKNANGKWLEIVKVVPYCSRTTTVELAKLENVSLKQIGKDITSEMVVFTYEASGTVNGEFRKVDAVGACSFYKYDGSKLDPVSCANKVMHAETKAKRRATLEFCGIAFIDDSEVESIEGAKILELPKSSEVAESSPDTVQNATATTEKPKGNGRPGRATNTPAQAAVTPEQPSSDTTPQESVGTAPTSTPEATESPKQDAGTPAAASNVVELRAHASTFEGPARFKDYAALFAGDTKTIVADKVHVDFIVHQATKECNWTAQQMSQWLKASYGIVTSNMKETLTLEVFHKIAIAFDTALTSAGR